MRLLKKLGFGLVLTGIAVSLLAQVSSSSNFFPPVTGYQRLISDINGLTSLSTTSATAQNVAALNLPLSLQAAGGLFEYCVFASSATAIDSDCASVHVSAVNLSGTVTATCSAVIGDSTTVTSGTLAATPTCVVSGTQVILKVTPTWATIVPNAVYGTFSYINDSQLLATVF